MRVRSLLLTTLTSAAVLIQPAAGPAVADEGTHSANLTHVKRIPYVGTGNSGGTDIEFTSLEVVKRDASGDPVCVIRHPKKPKHCAFDHQTGEVIYQTEVREYAVAGSYNNGMHIFDVTDPEQTSLVGRYDCRISQGDVQIFERGGRTYAAYTYDDGYGSSVTTQCFQEAMALGLHPPRDSGSGLTGTFIADITDPTSPTTVSFVPEPRGSHNTTVAPGGRYLYNSNSDLTRVALPSIEVFDISDFSAPRKVYTLDTAKGVTGLSSHDITFNESGTRAYSAAITHSLVLDTTNLAEPKVIGRIVDPAVNIHHQSDPVTLTDAATGLKRTFLVVTDEIAGAAGNAACPGGGLHVYDITGPLENAPVKVGFWNIPSTRKTTATLGRCTSHVLRMHPDEAIMTIAWYNAGVRVVDISGLVGVSVGANESTGNVGAGMREIGFSYFPTSVAGSPSSETWSVKTNHIEEDGSFYLYGNDQNRGLDIYRFDGSAPESPNGGTWLTPSQALAQAQARGVKADPGSGPFCVYLGVTTA